MGGHIVFPHLHQFQLIGFQPILNTDVKMTLGLGPNIILGGNGLGKTTIIQAVIYGLTGGNSNTEEEKSLRWNHKYFEKRLMTPSSAFVEIEFFLSDVKLSVRRGFRGAHVIAFRSDKYGADWIEKPHEASSAYEKAIMECGGYKNINDFEFLIHRLLYLPESRRSLAWDADAQLRTIISFNQDILREEEFRNKRAHLKNLDTEKRHTRVAINRLIDKIDKSKSAKLKNQQNEREGVDHIPKLLDQLHEKNKIKKELNEKQYKIQSNLTAVSDELDKIRYNLEIAEAQYLSKLLNNQEKANFLVLNKLVEHGLCPACGTHQSELQSHALNYLKRHSCVICGSDEPQSGDKKTSTLVSQLSSKLKSQKTLEKEYKIIANRLSIVRDQEMVLQKEFNKIRSENLDVKLMERELKVKEEKNPVKQRASLEAYEVDLIAQIEELELELSREYKKFHSAVSNRMEQLSEKYKGYATEFLGIACTLEEFINTEFIEFRTYVPKFNDVARETPESCSEAQRFFLDIAFRIAIIDFVSESGDGKATFFCETPETALDLSYISNVVKMFNKFTRKKHSLLLTSNIQTDSIAKDLLLKINKSKRKNQLLNLLEIGDLSTVQKKAKDRLNAVVDSILR